MTKAKLLIIRFSSIGDIVLTTPVVRCLKRQLNASLHFLVKKEYRELVAHNPYLDHVHSFDKSEENLYALSRKLKKEQFNLVIDLQNNLRSRMLTRMLGLKSIRFNKLNKEKILLTRFKINRLPQKHLIDRYFEAMYQLKIKNDGLGLDLHIPVMKHMNLQLFDRRLRPGYFNVIVAGAMHQTKNIPTDKLIELCQALPNQLFVILGGTNEKEKGESIANHCKNTVDLCGKLSLLESASVIDQCRQVISPDTGMMHIAAALNRPIISVWGNTVPQFGMFPYYKKEKNKSFQIVENLRLNCRPCSKLGHAHCPRGHFYCMNQLNTTDIIQKMKPSSTMISEKTTIH